MDGAEAAQKASAQGNLKDTKEQKVITEQVATQTVIKIEPADPQVVYVPSYNPAVVYGRGLILPTRRMPTILLTTVPTRALVWSDLPPV